MTPRQAKALNVASRAMRGGLVAATLVSSSSEVAAQANPSEARAIINKALELAGGEQAYRGVQALRFEAQTARFQVGQEAQPRRLPVMDVRSGSVIRDLVGRRTSFRGEHRGGAGWGCRFSTQPYRWPGDRQ